jgi:hypothetical protein
VLAEGVVREPGVIGGLEVEVDEPLSLAFGDPAPAVRFDEADETSRVPVEVVGAAERLRREGGEVPDVKGLVQHGAAVGSARDRQDLAAHDDAVELASGRRTVGLSAPGQSGCARSSAPAVLVTEWRRRRFTHPLLASTVLV